MLMPLGSCRPANTPSAHVSIQCGIEARGEEACWRYAETGINDSQGSEETDVALAPRNAILSTRIRHQITQPYTCHAHYLKSVCPNGNMAFLAVDVKLLMA
jgi:hypothetical protein